MNAADSSKVASAIARLESWCHGDLDGPRARKSVAQGYAWLVEVASQQPRAIYHGTYTNKTMIEVLETLPKRVGRGCDYPKRLRAYGRELRERWNAVR